MVEILEWNINDQKLLQAFPANRDQVGGSFKRISFDDILLLHTIGAKSGFSCVNILTFNRQ
jgi:hypothetical protein